MKGLDGIQGPVYVGTGCVFNRQALYGYGPANLPVLPKSSFCSSCCCCCNRSKKSSENQIEVYRDARREDLNSAIFNLREIDSKHILLQSYALMGCWFLFFLNCSVLHVQITMNMKGLC